MRCLIVLNFSIWPLSAYFFFFLYRLSLFLISFLISSVIQGEPSFLFAVLEECLRMSSFPRTPESVPDFIDANVTGSHISCEGMCIFVIPVTGSHIFSRTLCDVDTSVTASHILLLCSGVCIVDIHVTESHILCWVLYAIVTPVTESHIPSRWLSIFVIYVTESHILSKHSQVTVKCLISCICAIM